MPIPPLRIELSVEENRTLQDLQVTSNVVCVENISLYNACR